MRPLWTVFVLSLLACKGSAGSHADLSAVDLRVSVCGDPNEYPVSARTAPCCAALQPPSTYPTGACDGTIDECSDYEFEGMVCQCISGAWACHSTNPETQDLATHD